MLMPQERLFQRAETYYYRRRIPSFLRNTFKSKVFVISLKTSSLSDARKLAACYDSKFDYLTTQHIMHGFKIYPSKILKFTVHTDKDGNKRHEITPEDLLAMQHLSPAQISAVMGTNAEQNYSPAQLSEIMSTKAALMKQIKDYEEVDHPTITEVFEKFIAHKKGNDTKYKINKNHGTFVRRFTEIMGDQKINKITRDDAREVKKILKKLPNDPAPFRGLTVQQVLDKYTGDVFLTVRSLNNHIDLYKSLWDFINSDIDKNINNVFKELREIERDKKRLKTNQLIKSFTRHDIDIIFSYPRFTKQKYYTPQQYWAPLISLFTGARRAEIAQLHKTDIYKNTADVWVFDFNEDTTPDSPHKKLKNAGSMRKTPIHPFLLNIGFLDFVDSVNHVRIFPELKTWDEDEGYGRNIGDNFNSFIHKLGFDEDKVFHSFRGTFSSELERQGVIERTRFLLSGREERVSKTTEEKRYLDDRESIFLLEELSKLDYSKELANVRFKKASKPNRRAALSPKQ
jgi:integrase